jgi:hypothetical protein
MSFFFFYKIGEHWDGTCPMGMGRMWGKGVGGCTHEYKWKLRPAASIPGIMEDTNSSMIFDIL